MLGHEQLVLKGKCLGKCSIRRTNEFQLSSFFYSLNLLNNLLAYIKLNCLPVWLKQFNRQKTHHNVITESLMSSSKSLNKLFLLHLPTQPNRMTGTITCGLPWYYIAAFLNYEQIKWNQLRLPSQIEWTGGFFFLFSWLFIWAHYTVARNGRLKKKHKVFCTMLA